MEMIADKKKEWIEKFFSDTGRSYDRVVNIFTLGIDSLWKKKIVEKMASPKKVLDLACGTGILTIAIAKQFPKCEVTGVDISPNYLEVAWRKAHKHHIKNIAFVLSPAEEFTSQDLFDVVTASYLAKYANIPLLIKNLSGMIAPGGTLIFHDFTYPKTESLQSLFEGYFKLFRPLGGVFFPEWKAVFHELPNVIRETKWIEELTETLKKEGFRDIKIESLTLEGSAIVTASRL
jgi:demethylmenaquinone methyltransferase/2-methoxy-6-polyprenyl-1,4-benzoquinol methylase